MKEQEYENLLRDAYEQVLNRKNVDASDKIFSKDVTMYDGKDIVKGLEEAKKLIRARSEAIPNFHCTIEDILISKNKAAVRWKCSGKAIKDFANFKANKEICYQGVTIFEAKDNRIVRLWQYGTAVDIVPKE